MPDLFSREGEHNLGMDAFPDSLSTVSNSSNTLVAFGDPLEACLSCCILTFSVPQDVIHVIIKCFLKIFGINWSWLSNIIW